MAIEFSFLSTVYNNAKTIRSTLESIVNAIHRSKIYSEIIVIDNYSFDGTFEILKTMSTYYEKDDYVKRFTVIRKRCSRGWGRQLALQSALGNYVIFFDGDSYYKADLLSCLLKLYYENFRGKVLLINNPGFYGIFPRDIALRIGFRDLNYAEDIDFLTRLLSTIHEHDIVSLPISLTVNEPVKGDRERRYEKGLSYVSRIIRNRIDRAISYGLAPHNGIIMFRRIYGLPLTKAILLTLINAGITFLYGVKIKPVINKKPNNVFVDEKYLERLIDPIKFGILIYPINPFIRDVKSHSTREIHYMSKNALMKAFKI